MSISVSPWECRAMARTTFCDVCGAPVINRGEYGGMCSPGCESVAYCVEPRDFDVDLADGADEAMMAYYAGFDS